MEQLLNLEPHKNLGKDNRMREGRTAMLPHRCRAHTADTSVHMIKTEERFWGIGGHFEYMVCPTCGSWAITPLPNDETLAEHYDGYYPPEEYRQRLKQPITGVEKLRAQQTLVTMKKLGSFGRLKVLDVGTGCAGYLAAIRSLTSVDVHGCDQNPDSADFAKRLFDIPVTVGSVADVPTSKDTYDLITLWHCFEHVKDPYQTLLDIRRLLAPNGVLLIEVPTIGFWARVFRGSWLFLQAPTHLNLFTPAALVEYLNCAGFQVLQLQRPWSPTEWAGSLLFRLGFSGFMPNLYFGPKRTLDHLWRLLFFALMPIDLLCTGLSALFGSSGLMRIYARPESVERIAPRHTTVGEPNF